MEPYFWRWIKTALWRAPSAVDFWSGTISAALGYAAHFSKWVAEFMNDLAYEIPLWVVAGIVLVRLVAAPFEIAKADATKIRELEQKLAAHLGPARNGWFSYAIRYGVFGRWPQNDDDLALPCFSIYDGSTLSDEDAKVITRAKLVLRFLRQAASDGHAHLTVWGYSNPGELILGAQDSDEKTLVKIDASHWETYTVDIEDVLSNPAHVHTKQPNHPMFDEGSFSALRVCKEQVESVLAAKQSEIEEYLSADA
jgi:hypothetical protein